QLAEVARLGELDAEDVEAQIALLSQWMAEDRKITPLKALQGMIWKYGYEQGHFKGHVYPDAVDRLRQWHAEGVQLYVYSSGSVQAQKLIFGYSECGDLTPLFSGYFDTNIGGKREVDSYRQIVAELGLPAAQVLFLSDIEEELQAAQAAGMQVCWLVRTRALPSNVPYPVVADCSSIPLAYTASLPFFYISRGWGMDSNLEDRAFLGCMVAVTILFGFVLKPFFGAIFWAGLL